MARDHVEWAARNLDDHEFARRYARRARDLITRFPDSEAVPRLETLI